MMVLTHGSFEYDMKYHYTQQLKIMVFDDNGQLHTGMIYNVLVYPGDKKCEVVFMGIGKLYDNAHEFDNDDIPKHDVIMISVGRHSTLDIKYNDGTNEIIETKSWILRRYNKDIWHGGIDNNIDISKVHSAIITLHNHDKSYHKGRVLLTSNRNEFDPTNNREGIIFQGVDEIKEYNNLGVDI